MALPFEQRAQYFIAEGAVVPDVNAEMDVLLGFTDALEQRGKEFITIVEEADGPALLDRRTSNGRKSHCKLRRVHRRDRGVGVHVRRFIANRKEQRAED